MKTAGKLFVILVLVSAQWLGASTIDFFYSFPLNGGPDEVIGMGTLTISPISGGLYSIDAITGTRTVAGVTEDITGLLAPNGFGKNDNHLSLDYHYIDYNGFSFTVNGGGDNGMGDVNVFYVPRLDMFTEESIQVGYGPFTIGTVPEPAPPTFAVLLLFGAAAWWRRKRRVQA